MKEILLEGYKYTKRKTGLNPTRPDQFQQLLASPEKFNSYVYGLSEGLDKNSRRNFIMLANNTKKKLIENSMYQLNPYETLSIPVLRVFYPKFVSKDAVTVTPIDKPDVIKGFLKPTFKKYNDPTKYAAPSMTDISAGPSINTPVGSEVTVPSTTDLLAIIGLTPDIAHVQKDLLIYEVADSAAHTASVNITPTVDGTIAADVVINGVSDTLLGSIDYFNGTITLSSSAGVVTKARLSATVSLEENTINPKIELAIEKIRMAVTDREISAEWSVQMEQDIKALFDIDIQSEIVSIIGQQLALDLDRQVLNTISATVQNPLLVPTTHIDSFSKTPPTGYTWGPKMWYENILVKLTALSAVVYNDTNIASCNTILCNPMDASILESLQEFNYTGSSEVNGDLGYRTATISGKWTVLVSSSVQQGKMLLVYKPVEEMKAVYLFCPYQPSILMPFPLGNKPSLTILSRNANAMIRPLGVALLNITA